MSSNELVSIRFYAIGENESEYTNHFRPSLMSTDSHPDEQTRDAVSSCYDHLPSEPSGGDVVFGFDGFVDNVRTAGRSADDGTDTRIQTLAEFGNRIVTSAGANSSLSISWKREGRRTGGHVSHLSRVYQELGFDPTMIGMCGDPILEIFEREFIDCTIYSLGDPGITDAIEFDDGKLMLMESGDAETFDWEVLRSRVGVETLIDELDGARLLGIGYWAMIPALAGVLDGLREHVFPKLSSPPEHVLLDPANIRELERTRLEEVVAATRRLNRVVGVTVSANRFETKVLASELGGSAGDDIEEDAHAAFDALGIDRFVGHSVTSSVVVSDEGSTSVAVPPVESPELTTSAGDHFNAGLALGFIEGLPNDASVALGNAVAREFVRTGETPSYSDIVLAVASYTDQFD